MMSTPAIDLEQLAAQMQRRARARRGEGILARRLLAERDQLATLFTGSVGVTPSRLTSIASREIADDVLVGIVGQLGCRASGLSVWLATEISPIV